MKPIKTQAEINKDDIKEILSVLKKVQEWQALANDNMDLLHKRIRDLEGRKK